MPRIAECKVDAEYVGPHSNELKKFTEPGNWTKEKSEAFTAVMDSLYKAGYRSFSSSVSTIGLQRKGQSAIYRVPSGQRGALAAHAEKYVHIVCIDRIDNYSGRLFAFAPIAATGFLQKKQLNDDNP